MTAAEGAAYRGFVATVDALRGAAAIMESEHPGSGSRFLAGADLVLQQYAAATKAPLTREERRARRQALAAGKSGQAAAHGRAANRIVRSAGRSGKPPPGGVNARVRVIRAREAEPTTGRSPRWGSGTGS